MPIFYPFFKIFEPCYGTYIGNAKTNKLYFYKELSSISTIPNLGSQACVYIYIYMHVLLPGKQIQWLKHTKKAKCKSNKIQILYLNISIPIKCFCGLNLIYFITPIGDKGRMYSRYKVFWYIRKDHRQRKNNTLP